MLEQDNLFSHVCYVFLFTLHWVALVQPLRQMRLRPLMVWKCFPWHSGSDLLRPPEERTLSYWGSSEHCCYFFILSFQFTSLIFLNWKQEDDLDALVCLCVCIHVGLHWHLFTAVFSLQLPTVTSSPQASAVCREICQSRAVFICSYLKLCCSSTGSSHSDYPGQTFCSCAAVALHRGFHRMAFALRNSG